jgi:hypothetical protein
MARSASFWEIGDVTTSVRLDAKQWHLFTVFVEIGFFIMVLKRKLDGRFIEKRGGEYL